MKFLIVTPSFNRDAYLEATIRSVVYQKGDFEIEYIVQDGASDDSVINILRKWQEKVNSPDFDKQCNHVSMKVFIEKDAGMYDAVNRAFARSSGDIMAWINTDDMYHNGSFAAASQVFSKFENVHWITGIPNSYNKNGTTVGFDSCPQAYSREYIKKAFYNVKYSMYGFNWIPQDCVFWRSSLWNKIGGRMNDSLKQAADFYLWQKFAEHADLVKVQAFLGGYRFHGEQFTANPAVYQGELPEMQNIPTGYKVVYKVLQKFPSLRKFIFNKKKGFPFLYFFQLKWEWIVGRHIRWNYGKQEWIIELRSIF